MSAAMTAEVLADPIGAIVDLVIGYEPTLGRSTITGVGAERGRRPGQAAPAGPSAFGQASGAGGRPLARAPRASATCSSRCAMPAPRGSRRQCAPTAASRSARCSAAVRTGTAAAAVPGGNRARRVARPGGQRPGPGRTSPMRAVSTRRRARSGLHRGRGRHRRRSHAVG